MSESSSDTESSCGWTVISNEGSDIETLGPETGADYDQEEVGRTPAPDQPASPREADAAAAAGDSSLDATLIEETVVEAESGQQAGEEAGQQEHVTLCSSSDHSDIITLGDSRETEIGAWEEPVAKEDEETTNEELYLGTSSSSQYTFSAGETTAAGWLKIGRGFCRSVGCFSGRFTEQLYNTRSFSGAPSLRLVQRIVGSKETVGHTFVFVGVV